jgi:hypothetical protein
MKKADRLMLKARRGYSTQPKGATKHGTMPKTFSARQQVLQGQHDVEDKGR